jgi:hypothetical protein
MVRTDADRLNVTDPCGPTVDQEPPGHDRAMRHRLAAVEDDRVHPVARVIPVVVGESTRAEGFCKQASNWGRSKSPSIPACLRITISLPDAS